ncbi:hypothetical protein L7F22_042986 [Adiantum nelumboides]|nr:hypothetical protein [Adiantum nelumboides]
MLGGRALEIRCKPAVLWRGRVAEGRHQVRAVHMEPAASAELASTENGAKASDSLAQYVVIRKDLVDSLKWPLGSVLAQACHAAVAAVWLHKDHPNTLQYCGNLDSMTTVSLLPFHALYFIFFCILESIRSKAAFRLQIVHIKDRRRHARCPVPCF